MFQFGPITLRAWEREDLRKVHTWENDFETMLYSRAAPHQIKSYDEIVKYYDEEIGREDRIHYIVELQESEKPIGTAVIRLHSWGGVRRGNIGTYLDKEYWNLGLGKVITVALLELCFNFLNLEKCEACSVEYNKRAHKVLQKCGFELYGKSRKAVFILGKRWDWYCFDILKEEYMNEREKLLHSILGNSAEDYIKKLSIL